MSRRIATPVFVMLIVLALAVPALANAPVADGLAWLKTYQQADGGFSNGFSDGSDLGTTCDVILAIVAGGEDASTWVSEAGNSPLDYLYSQVAAGAVDGVGLKAKAVLALTVTMLDPADFAGHNLIAALNATYDAEIGSYGGNMLDQGLAMLALFNAGEPVPASAAQYLLDSQCTDGAWAFFGGTTAGTGDTNTTAVDIQALLATGHRDEIGEAFAYLHRVQNDDGGFPYQKPSEWGTDTDANSTAYVVQALDAAGESMNGWRPVEPDPLTALNLLHDAESGGFFWQTAMPFPNVLATAQAIPALTGYTFIELPRVGVATLPGAVTTSADVSADAPLLPESGGMLALPLGLIVVGCAALGAGTRLRRR